MTHNFKIARVSDVQTSSSTGHKYFQVFVNEEVKLVDGNIVTVKPAAYNKGQRVPSSMVLFSEEHFELVKQATTITLEVF